MDFIAELLDKVPNKNYILLAISDRYAGNKEYIKNYRTPITHNIVREKLKQYQEQIDRGTISLRVVSKKIYEEMNKEGFYISYESIRSVISASLRQT